MLELLGAAVGVTLSLVTVIAAPKAQPAPPPGGPARHPVEVLEQRSETSTTYRHPNGARTLVFTTGPIRVQRGTGWAPVDLSLHRDPDGGVRPAASRYPMWLSGGGTTPDAASVRAPDGTNTALAWSGPLPAPRLDGTRAIYPDARPGADLVVEATRTGFVAALRRAIPLPAPPQPAANPAAESAEPAPANTAPAATAPAKPANSAPAATAPAEPQPEPAEPAAAPAKPAAPPSLVLRVTRPGGAESLEPAGAPVTEAAPPDMLAASPLLSQVVADAHGRTALPFDTSVQSTAPGADLSGDPELRVGGHGGGSVDRSFLSWDLSRLRGERVSSATLRVYSESSASCQPRGWEVWSSTGVGPATRWANQPPADRAWATSTATKGHDGACRPGWTSVDLTDLVQSWVRAGANTGTVMLRATDEADPLGWKVFDSGEGAHVPALGVTLEP